MFRCRHRYLSVYYHHICGRRRYAHTRHRLYSHLCEVSAVLRGRRHDLQTGEKPTSETYSAEPRKVGGSDALPPAAETAAVEAAEKYEYHGTILCCIGGDESNAIVYWCVNWCN